jgi:hypothetical protein
MCLCSIFFAAPLPHSGEIQEFNDGFEVAWQVIVEFYEFCWVHEAFANIRLIQQLDMRLAIA